HTSLHPTPLLCFLTLLPPPPTSTLFPYTTLFRSYEPGFPARMNDLMFFNTPAIADLNGDGRAEVVQSSAMYDVRAYGLGGGSPRSEEHTSELQSRFDLVCRLLLEKKKKKIKDNKI